LEITRRIRHGPKEQAVLQKFSLDGKRDVNPTLDGFGQFISECRPENGGLTIFGKQVVKDSELIIREAFALSREGKRLSIRISGYHRANQANDPKTFTGDDPRWDVIYRQIFDRK
jgi:hypothetical protein